MRSMPYQVAVTSSHSWICAEHSSNIRVGPLSEFCSSFGIAMQRMETMSHWKVLPDNYNPSWGGYEMLGSGTAASVRIISILSTCLDSAGGEMRLKRALTLIIVICCLQTWSLLRQTCRQTCEWQKVE